MICWFDQSYVKEESYERWKRAKMWLEATVETTGEGDFVMQEDSEEAGGNGIHSTNKWIWLGQVRSLSSTGKPMGAGVNIFR